MTCRVLSLQWRIIGGIALIIAAFCVLSYEANGGGFNSCLWLAENNGNWCKAAAN